MFHVDAGRKISRALAAIFGLLLWIEDLQSEGAQWPVRWKRDWGVEGKSQRLIEKEKKRELKNKRGCGRAQTKRGGKKKYSTIPQVRLYFWLFVAKSTALGTQNLFAFLFPSELLLNCWAQLIVNYIQQAPTITSIEENAHHTPDHKCFFLTGVTYLFSKNLFILFLMTLAPPPFCFF